MFNRHVLSHSLTAVFASIGVSVALASQPLMIEQQGSFAAGGTLVEAKTTYDPYKPTPEGQTLHGDHAYVSYQIPSHATGVPLVFLHGAGQFSKTWDTTPDGREGFRTLFLRKGYPVYLVDQPRRGGAGRSTHPGNIKADPDEGFWFGQFRMGLWPKFYSGSVFPQDPQSLDQFFRQMTPNTAPYDLKVNAAALTAVMEKTGKGVLVTHSQGCGVGWFVGMQSDNIAGIAAWEPGSGFPFPKNEMPKPIPNHSFFGPMTGVEVTPEDFQKLTRFPIVIYYGDFIPDKAVDNPHTDYWRAALQLAKQWAAVVNRHGGNVTVVHLPEVGIKGNSHFLFAEKNNEAVATLFSEWLTSHGFAKSANQPTTTR